jgi:ABC-2 type transport system ATP-binding protein
MIQLNELRYWHDQYNNPVLSIDNLQIRPGITGLLGANGAGKSTLLRILSTAISAKEGNYFYNKINVFENPKFVRKVLGYLPQNFTFYQKMTVQEVLNYMAALKLVSKSEQVIRINYLLNIFNLTELRNTPIEHLSGGMKQRLGLSQVFLNQPNIILLDEPTQGLDPIEKKSLFLLLKELGNFAIIVMSSHYIEEMEDLCHDIIILSKGNIKYQGSKNDLMLMAHSSEEQKKISLNDIFLNFSNNK